MCCGLPAGGIPWIALAAFLLDPEARQTDSKKLAHRLISCIRSPASAACNSSWGRKKSGQRSKDASMPVQQNSDKNPVSLLRVKTFEAKSVVQSTQWDETERIVTTLLFIAADKSSIREALKKLFFRNDS